MLEGKEKWLTTSKPATADFLNDNAPLLRYRRDMIIRATNSFWYFSYGCSLAAGGSRAI
jgi:hypothetical protein